MGEVKTTLVLDDKVWSEFRNYVLSKYGSIRKFSLGVTEALQSFNSLGLLESLTNSMKIELSSYPSSKEVKARRPKTKVSAGRIIREMRDARQTHLSGLK